MGIVCWNLLDLIEKLLYYINIYTLKIIFLDTIQIIYLFLMEEKYYCWCVSFMEKSIRTVVFKYCGYD